jgi:hypothetical protein
MTRARATVGRNTSTAAVGNSEKLFCDEQERCRSDPAFGLQRSPSITGLFTNDPTATSPYTQLFNVGQLFFDSKEVRTERSACLHD